MDDVLGNAVEVLHSYMYLRGDKCDSLSKHMEVLEQRWNVMKEAGASFANDKIWDACVAELVSRNQQRRNIFLKWNTCKEETIDSTEREGGREALKEDMRARVYVKSSGHKYAPFRR